MEEPKGKNCGWSSQNKVGVGRFGVGRQTGPTRSQPYFVRLVKQAREIGFDPEGKGES